MWITGDQCTADNTALFGIDKSNATVLMIESVGRGRQIRYHKHKLVLIYSVMRHFACELREAGWDVYYVEEAADFASALKGYIEGSGSRMFRMMSQSEYGVDEKLMNMAGPSVELEITGHSHFISKAEEFEALHRGERVTMEYFYREMRRKTGFLMKGERPEGDRWNFDKENRKPPSRHEFFEPMRFEPDAVTRAVMAMVDRHFADHPGSTRGFSLAVTRTQALARAREFMDHQLDDFGPMQDAMLAGNYYMNHSVLSPYVNTCLLHPLELCAMAEQKYKEGKAALSSVEGFIRQLIGWREFVWRVYWRVMPDYRKRNHLGADIALPEIFWTGDTRMRCLAEVLKQVIETGYAHHIQRLMILGNFALVAGLEPEQVNDWFWAMFVDGYDWVMVPNVIGMALHADGGYVGTKPYAASANYISKMSDYCKGCYYWAKEIHGEKACPFNSLYWDFLDRNRETFSGNHRMAIVMKALAAKDPEWLARNREQAGSVREKLRKNTLI